MQSKLKRELEQMWRELIDAIDRAAAGPRPAADVVFDYATHHSNQRLMDLLEREYHHERGHRGFVGGSYPLSPKLAATLVLLENIGRGADRPAMPDATIFILLRDTAAEAQLLGYLLKDSLSQGWIERAKALDYSATMNPKPAAGRVTEVQL